MKFKLFDLLKRAPKVNDADDKKRLTVLLNERPLREAFRTEHYQDVLRAREYWFQNTPQLFNNGKLVINV
jgi:hypothetical protein